MNRPRRGIFLAGLAAVVLTAVSLFLEKSEISVQPSNSEQLRSLPYLSFVVDERNPGADGVVVYDAVRAAAGSNLYASRETQEAYLVDMHGRLIRHWNSRESGEWQHVEMCSNGGIIVVVTDSGLMKLDARSRIQWKRSLRAHHDVAFADNGDIYALARKDRIVIANGIPTPVLSDYISVLSADGKILREIPLYDVVRERIPARRYQALRRYIRDPAVIADMVMSFFKDRFFLWHDTPVDVTHVNTVEILPNGIPGICRAGDLLVCFRELDLVGIIDRLTGRLVWSWGEGFLERPHHPTLLTDGTFLIFDNGTRRKYSRIIRLDPSKMTVVWEYTAEPPDRFYSLWGGSNQLLPNGNILITESGKGRAFEITPDAEIVWEFFNPAKSRERGKRKTIYRMTRVWPQGVSDPPGGR